MGWRDRGPLESVTVAFGCVTLFVALHALVWSGVVSEFTAWNLPMGLGLGVLLGYGLGYTPVVIAAHLLAPAVVGSSPPLGTAIVTALGHTLVLVLGVTLIRWLSGSAGDDLTRRRTFVAFMAAVPAIAALQPAAALILGPFLATGWPAALRLAGDSAAAVFWGNLAGILLTCPLGVMSRRYYQTRPGRENSIAADDPSSWPYIRRASIVGAVFAGSCYLGLTQPPPNEFWLFAIVSAPLISASWAFGLLGLAPVLIAVGLAAAAGFEIGSNSTLPTQLAVIAAAANSSVLGLLVTEQRRHQGTMNHQAALMDSVGFATAQLLGMTDQEKNVTEVLQHLASEARLDRIYVLENRPGGRDAGFPALYELGPDLDPELHDVVATLRGKHIRKNAHSLEQGHALELTAGDLPARERDVFRTSGIEGTLILPVFADGRWWGCLGLDQGSDVLGWSKPDIATFEATASVLGALLAHTNVEQQFRQFTGSIPVVFWIASPDVMHKTYVSPAYEQIWGRSRDGIQENPRSWMAAIYHDDYARMSELLEGNPQAEYAEEYRIIRGDRSIRWIRDTGFSVVNASGEVNRIVGIAQDITPQKEAEERLRASEEQIRTSLNEKEVLLKEIHHRVKNNLQVISSLLSLQAGQIHDREAAEVFKDSQYRVRAMALVHERLYQSDDLARIDFAGYVRDMTSHLLRSYRGLSRGIRLIPTVEGVSLDVDAAIPCALIINELVSNALKYAFPDGQSGEIRVTLVDTAGVIIMTISDDGIGLPDGTAFETSDSLGLQLVHSLTDQLGGTVECSVSRGTHFEIRFPSPEGTT
jgi:PAS domain S-box-containing protein